MIGAFLFPAIVDSSDKGYAAVMGLCCIISAGGASLAYALVHINEAEGTQGSIDGIEEAGYGTSSEMITTISPMSKSIEITVLEQVQKR